MSGPSYLTLMILVDQADLKDQACQVDPSFQWVQCLPFLPVIEKGAINLVNYE